VALVHPCTARLLVILPPKDLKSHLTGCSLPATLAW
jgi:hypothetical protein